MAQAEKGNTMGLYTENLAFSRKRAHWSPSQIFDTRHTRTRTHTAIPFSSSLLTQACELVCWEQGKIGHR